MQQSWVPLECIDCDKQWKQAPEELPVPGNEFVCDDCGSQRLIEEFVRTQEGLDVLREFHE